MINTNTNNDSYQAPQEITDAPNRVSNNEAARINQTAAEISPHPPEAAELLKADKARREAERAAKRLPFITAGQLIQADLPPAETLLAPWLQRGTIANLVATAGIGKTWAALTIAQALATGGTAFGRWNAPTPRRVLYLDGEMSLQVMQTRLKMLQADNCGDNITLYNPDLDRDSPPVNIADAEGQERILTTIKDCNIDVVVVDNVASLYRTGADSNSAESWGVMQDFELKLRREQLGVIVVDHLPKSKEATTARGTSAKNDVIDVGLLLRRPEDYEPEQGAVFVVQFSKHRGLYGADVQPFEARLDPGSGQWITEDYTPPPSNKVGRPKSPNYDKVVTAYESGITDPKEISNQTGTPLRSVYNYLNDYGWADADGYHGYSADDSNDYQ